MATRIEVDSDFAVRIFHEGEETPFLFQPTYPNNDKFDSAAEAQAWADSWVVSFTDPKAPNAPAGKGLKGEPKLVVES